MSFEYKYQQSDFSSTTIVDIADLHTNVTNLSWVNSNLRYINSNSTNLSHTAFAYTLIFTNALTKSDKQILDACIANYTFVLLVSNICLIKDVKAPNISGGTFIKNAWVVRTLNSIQGLTNFITLNNNQITLTVPGYYSINIKAPAYNVQVNQARLHNVTDNIMQYGSNAYAGTITTTQSTITTTPTSTTQSSGGNISHSEIMSIFTITKPTTFQVEHMCSTTCNVVGFGLPTGFGFEEIYTQVTVEIITRT